MERMKRRLLFLFFGIVLGGAIFWLPTVFWGGSGFALPILFFAGPWYLIAIPHLVVFALVFAILAGLYRLAGKHFPVSLSEGLWILLGLYLSLTLLFHFVGVAVMGGTLTI